MTDIVLLQAKIKSNNFTHSQFRWYVFEVAKWNAPRWQVYWFNPSTNITPWYSKC